MKDSTKIFIVEQIPFMILCLGILISNFTTQYAFPIGFLTGMFFFMAREVITELLKNARDKMEHKP